MTSCVWIKLLTLSLLLYLETLRAHKHVCVCAKARKTVDDEFL